MKPSRKFIVVEPKVKKIREKFNLSQNDMYRENAIKCYEEAKQYVDFPWPYHIPNYSISFEFEIDSNMIMENNDTSFQTIFEVNF